MSVRHECWIEYDERSCWLQDSLGDSITSRRFATELVAAVNKVNYNQDSGLNAFAGTACVLPPQHDLVL